MENEQTPASDPEHLLFENQQIEEISQIHLTDTALSQTSLVTVIDQRPLIVNAPPRPQNTLTRLLNSATNNMYEEYPYVFKTIGFGVLLTLCGLLFIGLIYSQPGGRSRIRWKKTMKKFKRYSENLGPSISNTLTDMYPVMKQLIRVAQTVINNNMAAV